MSIIHSQHRGRSVVLGRRAASPRVLGVGRVAAYRALEAMPEAPQSRDWLSAVKTALGGQFGMMLNDSLGCCTVADGPGHLTQVWSANTGAVVTPPDSAILKGYEVACGYRPADPSTDQGGVETEVLADWRAGALPFDKIDVWLPVNPQNQDHVRKAINLFGALYTGVALPLSAQDQARWSVAIADDKAAPGSWGGHAVSWSNYDFTLQGSGLYTCITWGEEQEATDDWLLGYCDEAYALLCTILWCRKDGASPLGHTPAELRGWINGVAS